MKNLNLLPIGQRVTHFDGGLHTHGKGTIVAYNVQRPNLYIAEGKLADAAEVAGKAGLTNALVGSLYDGVRCPYVRFDTSEKYPDGYKDVYEPESINPIIQG